MKLRTQAEFDKARELLRQFKGDAYLFGKLVLSEVGQVIAPFGSRVALVRGTFGHSDDFAGIILLSLMEAGGSLDAEIKGARPNSPREDVLRIAEELKKAGPEVIVSFGGGSTIDATKAADVLCTLGGRIDDYFGVGLVSAVLGKAGKSLVPHIAIQTVASSAAHLTKYANVTDVATAQKKLIVDDAIVPARCVFDYQVSFSTAEALVADGAFDGLSHSLEVLYGAAGKPYYDKARDIAQTCITLIVEHLPHVMADPQDTEAREALCLATDLGGYAIMVGGTSGGHLTSFSLVDVLSHGRACGIMNPYYTVFFAPAIEEPLRLIGRIYRQAGLMQEDPEKLSGRELGVAVARAMLEFAHRVGVPTRLSDVAGFSETHIERALTAAKNPQLRSKLQNMPVPMTPETVDTYMRPILEAAASGDLSSIRNV
ncbi:MAG: iron-containing alcohol dehydrogenase [Sedimentisphaerales bacterium]|nr:iron-containing alcohol dehydrogenase [Sedimentisphaerales bacterium]